MSVLPTDKLGKISWCENHTTPLSTNAVAVGTTTTAVTDLATKTVAARAAYNGQQAAQGAAKAATNTYNMAVAAMASAAQAIIDQVRVKSVTAGDSVYSLAEIPIPAAPSPIGELGKPFDFTCEVTQLGTLSIKWKCTNPRGATGTVYQIYRRLGESGDYTYIGGVGPKKFVDDSVPAGTTEVQYQIQAVRSTSEGPWALFIVKFGVGGAGASVVSVAEGTPQKLAA